MCPCGSRGWEASGSSARVPGNKNTTYFSNCCLFPLQSIGIINKLPIKKKLCVGEKQVRVPRELPPPRAWRGAGVVVPLADHSWDGALWGLQDSGGRWLPSSTLEAFTKTMAVLLEILKVRSSRDHWRSAG